LRIEEEAKSSRNGIIDTQTGETEHDYLNPANLDKKNLLAEQSCATDRTHDYMKKNYAFSLKSSVSVPN